MRWAQLFVSLKILWYCLSLGLEWKLTFSSPVPIAEFSTFPGILRVALGVKNRKSKHSLWMLSPHLPILMCEEMWFWPTQSVLGWIAFTSSKYTLKSYCNKMWSYLEIMVITHIIAQVKKRWQEYTEELYKKDLNDSDNCDGVITCLEPDILELKSSGP